ncbi:hypothetical protein EYC59_00760 [Candidatus Saccharibacteria bacterium]|nr:MAG: hypothetical protein EYC59_00760 [Candidatus Saccharibacteria bacterium]
MEPHKAPEEDSPVVTASPSPPGSAGQSTPPAETSAPQPDAPAKAESDTAQPVTKASDPAKAGSTPSPKEQSNKPVGFIIFGAAVLVVLLVLAFIAYSKQ